MSDLTAAGHHINKAFLAKAIDRAQRTPIVHPFGAAVTEFIIRAGALAWDDRRALFWVEHPQHGWQVAVWMMPVAERFAPAGVAK